MECWATLMVLISLMTTCPLPCVTNMLDPSDSGRLSKVRTASSCTWLAS